MKVIIDKNGKVTFNDYFGRNHLEQISAFLTEADIDFEIEDTDREFKAVPALYKKHVVRDIEWSNYLTILKVITLIREGKDDGEIAAALGSQGTGFAITVKARYIFGEYIKLNESEITEEKLIDLAKRIAHRYIVGRQKIPIGQTVMIVNKTLNAEGKSGIVLENKDGYRIKLDDGFESDYARKDFEVKENKDEKQ